MQLYPAIDIKNGQCVRLSQGLFDQVSVYDNHPEDAAVCWEAQGATYLHVVDLDGALAGHPVNLQAIRNILTNVSVPIEVGGGIRTMKDAETLLNLGVGCNCLVEIPAGSGPVEPGTEVEVLCFVQ